MAECAEEMARLLREDNDSDSGDTVRINIKGLNSIEFQPDVQQGFQTSTLY